MEANEDPSNAGCDRHCANCKTTATPLWRKFGPVKFLCNACGLYYKVNHNHRPYYMSKNKLNSSAKKSLLRCANCGTNKTTMWRKNGGQHVCNPCGLYIRLNGHNRPVTMRKDIIRTRRRRDTAQFEMLDPIESCDNAVNVPVLTSIKKEELSNYEKHPYKMVLNVSRDHSFVLANGSETHETSHYGQHICPETYHLHSHHHANHNHSHNESNGFPLSQHINNAPVDPNNGYYCSFF